METSLTDGMVIIIPTNYNCGLTGGCEKCKPLIIQLNIFKKIGVLTNDT